MQENNREVTVGMEGRDNAMIISLWQVPDKETKRHSKPYEYDIPMSRRSGMGLC